MNVNSVMSTYNLNSLWNNLNSNSSTTSAVPLVDNLDDAVKENYTAMNYLGQTTSSELQDIYEQAEPDYGISLTYNQNGNLSIPAVTDLPTNGLSTGESNIVSLLDSQNSTSENSFINILSQYSAIEDGTYETSLSSILSNNASAVYNSINSLGNNETQSSGNNIDALV